MFQHHIINRNKNKKINDKKLKNTVTLLKWCLVPDLERM